MHLFGNFMEETYEITDNMDDKVLFKDIYEEFCHWVEGMYGRSECVKCNRTQVYAALRAIPECPNELSRNRWRIKYLTKRQQANNTRELLVREESIIPAEPIVEEYIIASEYNAQEELIIPTGPVAQIEFPTPVMTLGPTFSNDTTLSRSSAQTVRLRILSNTTLQIPSTQLSIEITNAVGTSNVTAPQINVSW